MCSRIQIDAGRPTDDRDFTLELADVIQHEAMAHPRQSFIVAQCG